MVLGRKKRLDDSFQSIEGSCFTSSDDDDDEKLMRGRHRSDEHDGSRKRRSRSKSVSRALASKFASLGKKLAGEDKNGDDHDVVGDDQSSKNPTKTPRRFLRSKSPDVRRRGYAMEDEKDDDGIKDERPSVLAAPSIQLDASVSEPFKSPTKSPTRRWRSPIKVREKLAADGIMPLETPIVRSATDETVPVADDEVSEHGSVVASVVSMFEWPSSPRRNRHKQQERKDDESMQSPSKSPRRLWRPQSPLKTRQDLSPSTVNTSPSKLLQRPAMLPAPSLMNVEDAIKDDKNTSSSLVQKPPVLAEPRLTNVEGAVNDDDESSKSPSRGPRRLWRSKTPETRNRHKLLDSPPDSPNLDHTDQMQHVEVNVRDDHSVMSEVSGCSSYASGRQDLVNQQQSRGSFRQNTRPNLVARQRSRPKMLAPPSQRCMETKTDSQRSLPGILRSGSNNSLGGSKWTGQSTTTKHALKPAAKNETISDPTGNDETMSQIPECDESNLDMSAMNMSKAISTLEQSQDDLAVGELVAKLIEEQGDPYLVKDVQAEEVKPTTDDDLLARRKVCRSNSESGARKKEHVHADEANYSKTVKSLVSPRKRTDKKMRSSKGGKSLPALPILKDEASSSERRSRSAEKSVARRVRGRSKGSSSSGRPDTSSPRKSERAGSKSSGRCSARGNSRGSSAGRSRRSSSSKTSPRKSSRSHKENPGSPETPRRRTRGSDRSRDGSSARESPGTVRSPAKNKGNSRSGDTGSSPSKRRPKLNLETAGQVEPKTPTRRRKKCNSSVTSFESSKMEPKTPTKRRHKLESGRTRTDDGQVDGQANPITPSRRRHKLDASRTETAVIRSEVEAKTPSGRRHKIESSGTRIAEGPVVGQPDPQTPSRRKHKLDASLTLNDAVNGRIEADPKTPGRRHKTESSKSSPRTPSRRQGHQGSERASSPAKSLRIRTKSVRRKSPKGSGSDATATPKRKSPRRRTRLGDSLSVIEGCGGQIHEGRKPTPAVLARSLSVNSTLTSMSQDSVRMKVKIKKKPKAQEICGPPPGMAQLNIPTLAQSQELQVEYSDAPQAPAS